MIQITPQMRVLVAVQPVDFRRGIDGLMRVCQEQLQSDPFSGCVFVFRSQGSRAIKLLVYDGQGFWLCHKRLSQGRFRHWPKGESTSVRLLSHELQVLLCGGNPAATEAPPAWRSVGIGS